MDSCFSRVRTPHLLQSQAPTLLARPQGPLQAHMPPPSSDITIQTLCSEESTV